MTESTLFNGAAQAAEEESRLAGNPPPGLVVDSHGVLVNPEGATPVPDVVVQDDHQLSAEHHEALQQEVLNSIAHHLVDEGARTDDGSALFDPDGNAGLVDVLSLLDQHVGHGLASDPEPFTTPGSDAHHSS